MLTSLVKEIYHELMDFIIIFLCLYTGTCLPMLIFFMSPQLQISMCITLLLIDLEIHDT
jgi:hypothetical protein